MRTSCLHYRCLLLLILTVISTCSGTQDKNKVPLEETITSHTFRPRRVDATVERIKLLRVPPGFSIGVFASGTGSPCMTKGMSDCSDPEYLGNSLVNDLEEKIVAQVSS